MSAKIEERTAAVIAEIKEELSVIEDHMIWLIRADQRFTVGQRVEWSRRARKRGFPKRKCAAKGVVKKVSDFAIFVQLDGYKHTKAIHHAFFNPVSGLKLF